MGGVTTHPLPPHKEYSLSLLDTEIKLIPFNMGCSEGSSEDGLVVGLEDSLVLHNLVLHSLEEHNLEVVHSWMDNLDDLVVRSLERSSLEDNWVVH